MHFCVLFCIHACISHCIIYLFVWCLLCYISVLFVMARSLVQKISTCCFSIYKQKCYGKSCIGFTFQKHWLYLWLRMSLFQLRRKHAGIRIKKFILFFFIIVLKCSSYILDCDGMAILFVNNNNNNRICIAQVCRITSEVLDGQLQSCYTARARPKCLTEEKCFQTTLEQS